MHEMSLAEGIRGIVEETIEARGPGRVRSVVVEIGELSAVEVDALRFCFDEVMRDGPAAGADMQVVRVAGSGWCLHCEAEVAMHRLYDPCPHCGGYRVRPTGGTAMRVLELELE